MLILAVFDFFSRFRRYLKPADRKLEPLFEFALQRELYEIMLNWLSQASQEMPVAQETVETTASVISWAIFGPAIQWGRGEQTVPAEEMAQRVLKSRNREFVTFYHS